MTHVLTSRGHQVLLDTDLRYDRGILSAAGTQLQRLHDPTFWALQDTKHVDVAVGIGMGAGPAAAVAVEG